MLEDLARRTKAVQDEQAAEKAQRELEQAVANEVMALNRASEILKELPDRINAAISEGESSLEVLGYDRSWLGQESILNMVAYPIVKECCRRMGFAVKDIPVMRCIMNDIPSEYGKILEISWAPKPAGEGSSEG
ncbi:MAG: hypothetical protein D6719_08560 [Candidatus Dadabacteria bacterium]|nr:MAG: hypothetical protein D6719_08560 [Candidatus Dadabacteria bacterium]